MMHSLVGGLFEKPPRSLIKSSIIEIYHQSWRKWGMAAVHSSQSRPLRKAVVELKYVENVLKKCPCEPTIQLSIPGSSSLTSGAEERL